MLIFPVQLTHTLAASITSISSVGSYTDAQDLVDSYVCDSNSCQSPLDYLGAASTCFQRDQPIMGASWAPIRQRRGMAWLAVQPDGIALILCQLRCGTLFP